ncbi:GntR family transcriptional regulator [Cupriavidus pauculus]|uniref:GntR family transcriptional regulator n=1 Tax=Cupriavidus pauculus TaxID=82633 RepID=UPI001EE1EB47|nr:GntR family transcriptional regulator [Cupriavidus pauculus]GJG95111.1 GntR family transcriptional regulator [Cupriavidus pauculus]
MQRINTPTYVRLREQIRADIAAGIWPLGAHITLAQMVDRYEVSLNPVREALLHLQGEGIIDMQMHRGAVIPTVDATYISNIYDMRGAIEQMLAAKVATLATPEDLEAIDAARLRHEELVTGTDIGACVAANREFHRVFNGVAGNQPAVDVLGSRSSLVDALRRSLGYGAQRKEAVITQHRKLVAAVRKGDSALAAKVALEHAESARDDLLRMIEKSH